MKKKFLYWFRDNPNRDLSVDVDWATARFLSKFKVEARILLIHPNEVPQYTALGLSLKIKPDTKIAEGYMGVQ